MRFSPASCAIAFALLLPAAPVLAADPDLAPGGRPGDITLAAPALDETAAASASGWYLRADTGYGAPSINGGAIGLWPVSGDSGGSESWVFGGGFGYQATPWLRADLTADHQAAGETGSATSFLASTYWDIATWNGLTPYVGGGLGFAVVTLSSGPLTGPFAQTDWQFSWALAAGLAWAVTPELSLDLGYRYVDFGGPDFEVPLGHLTTGTVAAQQVRIGLRYAVH